MSERGSFVTQYIYCKDCLGTLVKALCATSGKFFSPLQLPGYHGDNSQKPGQASNYEAPMPIIAGKIGALGHGDDSELVDRLRDVTVCCDVHFAVILDGCHPAEYVMRGGEPGIEPVSYPKTLERFTLSNKGPTE